MDQRATSGPNSSGSGGTPEESLVKALKAGDKHAAETFVRTHASWMLSVARRILADSALAEDCVQEAFIKAFQNIGGFEERSSLKSWL